MSEQPNEPVPALFGQCLEVWEAMSAEAELQQVRPDQDEEGLVYEGFLTRLITSDLRYSAPYYTRITQQLKAMDCILQLKRGGSTTPSRWLLLQKPTMELFQSADKKSNKPPRGWRQSIEQQIRDLNERLEKAGI